MTLRRAIGSLLWWDGSITTIVVINGCIHLIDVLVRHLLEGEIGRQQKD
jgi:hypothetical protein